MKKLYDAKKQVLLTSDDIWQQLPLWATVSLVLIKSIRSKTMEVTMIKIWCVPFLNILTTAAAFHQTFINLRLANRKQGVNVAPGVGKVDNHYLKGNVRDPETL